jgi:hypothetical protein
MKPTAGSSTTRRAPPCGFSEPARAASLAGSSSRCSGQALTFPQQRVFSREYGVRLPTETSAEFFRRRISGRGFTLDEATGSNRSSFVARRYP